MVVYANGSSFSVNQIIKELKGLIPKPVRYLVNTPIHGDHTNGNTAFAKAYPGLEMIATKFMRDGIARRSGKVTTPAKAEESNQAKDNIIAQ